MKVLGIIPARYGSTRFPGKPLIEIQGKSMIQRVYERASKSSALSKVVVATDDERIYKHVEQFGHVVMTSSEHPSGTDRCLEAYKNLGEDYDVVINIQGDEPLLDPDQLDMLASCFEAADCQIATLVTTFKSEELLFDSSKVKVIRDQQGNALYFSRQCIPFQQGREKDWMSSYNYLQHVGIYAFRSEVLAEVAKLPQSSLEKAESLEQLRWLDNGYSIRVELCDHNGISVDVPEDLNRVIDLLNKA
ncbi:MAG: 3-deoxy-manno-octulosonate cytidylyltransferase [Flavobacteriales bacterium]